MSLYCVHRQKNSLRSSPKSSDGSVEIDVEDGFDFLCVFCRSFPWFFGSFPVQKMLSCVVISAALTPRPLPPLLSAHAAPVVLGRREALATAAATLLLVQPQPAAALVKGSAPPPKMKPKERKCSSIDECEARGEKERAAMAANQDDSFERTVGGDRYRDLKQGSGKGAGAGDMVDIRYRVMRLGTRANDGLSGEGQTIFSFGYGEDEDKEGDRLTVQLGAGKSLVAGVDAALVGMKPGGRRRVLVRPERGWKLQTGACAGGVSTIDLTAQSRTTDAAGAGGNLVFKADVGVGGAPNPALRHRTPPETAGHSSRYAPAPRPLRLAPPSRTRMRARTRPRSRSPATTARGRGLRAVSTSRCSSSSIWSTTPTPRLRPRGLASTMTAASKTRSPKVARRTEKCGTCVSSPSRSQNEIM